MKKALKFLFILAVVGAGLYYGYRYLSQSTLRAINKEFPPLSVADQQTSSIQDNSRALDLIPKPDVAVNIGSKALLTLLDSASTHELVDTVLTFSHVRHYTLQHVKTGLDQQFIRLSADFHFELDTLQAAITGSLEGIISFGVQHDSLLFFPSIQTLHVDKVDLEDHSATDKSIVVKFLNAVLHAGMDNINGAVASKIHGIDLNLIHKKIDSSAVPQNDSINISFSKPIDLSLPPLVASILIDGSGLHLLATFDKAKGESGGTGKSPVDFGQFSKNFSSILKAGFPDAPTSDKTFIVLKKSLLAGQINGLLSDEVIDGTYKKDISPTPIDKEITIKSADIDCSKMQFNCPSLPMPPLPTPPSPCNFDCGKFNVGCKLAEKACQLGFGGVVATYRLTCESILAPWREKNLELQINCNSLKISAAASCVSLKTSIDALGGQVDLGSLHLDGKAHVKGTAEIKSIAFANDLSSVAFSLSASVAVPVHIDFQLHSKPAGRLTCPFDINHPVDCVGAGQLNNQVTSKITFTAGNKDTLLLGFLVAPLSAEAKLVPSPLEIINGTFSSSFVSCPILSQTIGGVGATLNVVKQFHDIVQPTDKGDLPDLIFNGNYKVSTGTYPINLAITCKPIKLFNDSLNLRPLVQPSYLGFQFSDDAAAN